jgi:hypothetical protein
MAKLTPEQRSALGRKGAAARYDKQKAEFLDPPERPEASTPVDAPEPATPELSNVDNSTEAKQTPEPPRTYRIPELTEARKRRIDAQDRRLTGRISPNFSPTGD